MAPDEALRVVEMLARKIERLEPYQACFEVSEMEDDFRAVWGGEPSLDSVDRVISFISIVKSMKGVVEIHDCRGEECVIGVCLSGEPRELASRIRELGVRFLETLYGSTVSLIVEHGDTTATLADLPFTVARVLLISSVGSLAFASSSFATLGSCNTRYVEWLAELVGVGGDSLDIVYDSGHGMRAATVIRIGRKEYLFELWVGWESDGSISLGVLVV